MQDLILDFLVFMGMNGKNVCSRTMVDLLPGLYFAWRGGWWPLPQSLVLVLVSFEGNVRSTSSTLTLVKKGSRELSRETSCPVL